MSASGKQGSPASPRKRPGRWRWRLLWGYLILLLISWVTLHAPLLSSSIPPELQITRELVSVSDPDGDPTTFPVAYRDTGEADAAQTLILLHGSPGSLTNFDHLTPLIKPNTRVIAIDLPGFGYAGGFMNDYSTRTHARVVLNLMDKLRIDSAHVLGFSMGSGVALNLHDLAPERIDSLIFYGGIGIQEGEGSGDYHFEHLKYRVGYPIIAVLPELIPHFGALGYFSERHAFLRNFMDTDQRPMRSYLEDVHTRNTPLLILHGVDDPLVRDWVAEAHHDIVQQSTLVMYDASHFMLFDPGKAQLIADDVNAWLNDRAAGTPTQRTTDNRVPPRDPTPTVLPVELDLHRGVNPWKAIGVIIVGTLILEDPTSVAVGLLVRDGQLDLFVGVFAVFVGIFLGDLLLYALGYFVGRRALAWGPVQRKLPTRHIDKLGSWIDRHGWTAVLASRFIPGTRLPLYVAAGAIGTKPWRFALWTLLAVAIWTPVILVSVLVLGGVAASPLEALFGRGWLPFIAAVFVLLLVVRALMLLTTKVGRGKLKAMVSALWQPEFWPPSVFYLPLVPWLVWLAVRYRSLTVWTLANPCMPDGGVVGESKQDILSCMNHPSVLRSVLIEPSEDTEARVLRALVFMEEHDGGVIVKPNAAQRGAGVRLVHNEAELRDALRDNPGEAIVQQYHPGPREVGVFYVRMPGDDKGRIFSITDKHFPVLTGDGQHTLEELIYRHPRLRMQAGVFLKRFGDERDRVLTSGEKMRLAEAGNHCQGTRFTDGTHLITPELEEAMEWVARALPGFYFGRIDLRFTGDDALRRGERFGVIEVNGVTSESTNIYDPDWPLLRVYRTLYAQWALVFAIGARVRRLQGITPKPLGRLLRDVWRYYRGRRVSLLSD